MNSSRAIAGWFWQEFLSPQRSKLRVAIALMVVEGALLGVLSFLLKPMFDLVFVGGELGAIWWVGFAIIAIFLIRGLASVGNKVLLTNALHQSASDLRLRLLRHVMALDHPFHADHPPGKLVEQIQGDVAVIPEIGQLVFVSLIRDSVALLSLFAVALWIDPIWTLFALVGVPILIWPSLFAQRLSRKKSSQAREIAAQMATRLDEVFHGIEPIKLNSQEDYQARQYRGLLDRRIKAETAAGLGRALTPGFIDVMTGLGFFAVLFFGGRDIIAGEKTVGDFMAFFTAVALMFEPVRKLGAVNGLWQSIVAGLERSKAVMDARPSIVSHPSPKVLSEAPADITFDSVSVCYNGTEVLTDVSFHAKRVKSPPSSDLLVQVKQLFSKH